MAPPLTVTTAVACVPGSVSPQVQVIGSGSTVVSPGPAGAAATVGEGAAPTQQQSKNCNFNADTIKLIDCVKARPALWHRKHLRQRVQVAHRGWEEIRKTFKANDGEFACAPVLCCGALAGVNELQGFSNYNV